MSEVSSHLVLFVCPEEGDQAGDEEKEANDGKEEVEEEDTLDRQKCQAALAALRHAKWFQVSTAGLLTNSLTASLFDSGSCSQNTSLEIYIPLLCSAAKTISGKHDGIQVVRVISIIKTRF